MEIIKLTLYVYSILFLVHIYVANGTIFDTKAICNKTSYPVLCYKSLAKYATTRSTTSSEDNNLLRYHDAYNISLGVTIEELERALSGFIRLQEKINHYKDDKSNRKAFGTLQLCHDLFSAAVRCLNDSSSVQPDNSNSFADLKVWLSAAGTHLQSCIDAIADTRDRTLRREVAKNMRISSMLTSNSLDILSGVEESTMSMSKKHTQEHSSMPRWLHSEDRELLEKEIRYMKIDAVVAKDGTGNYRRISDALKAAPDNSPTRYVIHVKKGVYDENVYVELTKVNVMMTGDGMDETIVSGTLNFADGIQTFKTATFAVWGQGFIARDMGFKNSAGPEKYQAVALMANADRGVYYRCKFDGYQDTLFAHAYRQFFRQCKIYGTIDFIFGEAAAVFQNCDILPKRPLHGQQNVITAQGKNSPREVSGFAIQDCRIYPAEDLTGVKTYLGRPWKKYSTTIFMHTEMAALIDPAGWVPYRGNTAPDTIYYAEFENSGPGAGVARRVPWKGLHLGISRKEANWFTVDNFIQGSSWIPSSGVAFKSGL